MFLPLRLFSEVILPLVVLAGIGWITDRRFKLSIDTIVKVTIQVLVPAFIFVRVVTSKLEPGVAPRMMLGTLAIIALMWVCGTVWNRWRGLSSQQAPVILLSAMFFNCGNFGLPAVELAFGPHAVEGQVFALLAMNVTTFTLGTFIASGAGSASLPARLIQVAKMPPIWAVILATVCRQTGFEPQRLGFIWHPLTMLSDALIGFMLLTLGIQLSQTKPPPLCRDLSALIILRLVLGPIFGWLMARALHLNAELTCVLTLASAAPSAINASLLAHEAGADTRLSSASVFYTTILSMISVTDVLVLLRWLYPQIGA